MGQSSWKLLRGEDLQTIQEEMATLEVEEEAKIGPVKVFILSLYSVLSKGILFAFHSIFAIKYIIVVVFHFLTAKGPILPVSLFASKRAYLAFFFIYQHRW